MSYPLLRKYFFFFGGSLVFLGIFFALLLSEEVPLDRELPKAVFINDKPFSLEFAVTKEEKALGLGERDSLCDTCAMLFVFETPRRQGFWMKGMRFPLDIAWLLSDTVVHIEHNIPNDSVEVFLPSSRADSVLEVNADVLKDVKVGDKLDFLRPVPLSFKI